MKNKSPERQGVPYLTLHTVPTAANTGTTQPCIIVLGVFLLF